jgi:maleamate amidohydrolase
MSDVYSAKSYGEHEIGFGDSIGILVVDFQRGFTEARFPMGGSDHVERAVTNTARLLEVARARRAPVASCYVAYANDEEHPHWKVGAVTRELRRGSEAVELDPRIADHDYDYVFEKWGASAFFMTPLSSFFTRHKVDTVAVTGCVTSGCVRASVVDAFQFGFRTMLVADCSGDQEEGPHNDTLRDVGRRYADIVGADDVIRRLLRNDPS